MHTDKPTTEQSNRSHNNAFSRTLKCLLFYKSKKKLRSEDVFKLFYARMSAPLRSLSIHSRICAGKSATYLQLLIKENEVFLIINFTPD